MAINATVFYTPDRQYRITSDTRNERYRIERDLVLVGVFTSLPRLESWLRDHGFDIAELIQD